MQKNFRVILSVFILIFSFVTVAGVFAQNVPVLGEIQSAGKVFIGTSNGQWTPAMPTYPVLQNTAIRTENGTASIFFKDGSRVELSHNTIAILNGEASNFTIHIEKGTAAFSIVPSSSLAISAQSRGIVASDKKDTVAGSVSVTGTCVEVKTISGKMLVNPSSAEQQILAADEKASYGNCSAAASKETPEGKPAYTAGQTFARNSTIALFGVGATWVYFKTIASPSKF